ncbi:MAG: hypothetical protein ACQEQO_06735 [Thermodesulfobacteriota bacterium]
MYEPGLDDVVRGPETKLFFLTEIENSTREADIILVSVTTPTWY